MAVSSGGSREGFAEFVSRCERRLQQALIATYGPTDGREAAVDALSWAWEHWDRVVDMTNPLGYLYRVGQSATRRFAAASIALDGLEVVAAQVDVHPELVPALRSLPRQQRTVVLLVHAYGWTQHDVANLLAVTPSTVQAHLARAVAKLRDELGARDVC